MMPENIKSQRWLGLRTALDAVASIAMLAATGLIVYSLWGSGQARPPRGIPVPDEPIAIDGLAKRGSPTATVGILAFSDFQCPFCGKFANELMPTIEEAYIKPGKVVFAYRHLPLQSIHPEAMKAAEAAECANREGKFWEVHDELFADPNRLKGYQFELLPQIVKLDQRSFGRCIAGEMSERIQRDLAEADRLGVRATPTFFVGPMEPGGKLRVEIVLSGARPYEAFRDAIDKALASGSR